MNGWKQFFLAMTGHICKALSFRQDEVVRMQEKRNIVLYLCKSFFFKHIWSSFISLHCRLNMIESAWRHASHPSVKSVPVSWCWRFILLWHSFSYCLAWCDLLSLALTSRTAATRMLRRFFACYVGPLVGCWSMLLLGSPWLTQPFKPRIDHSKS